MEKALKFAKLITVFVLSMVFQSSVVLAQIPSTVSWHSNNIVANGDGTFSSTVGGIAFVASPQVVSQDSVALAPMRYGKYFSSWTNGQDVSGDSFTADWATSISIGRSATITNPYIAIEGITDLSKLQVTDLNSQANYTYRVISSTAGAALVHVDDPSATQLLEFTIFVSGGAANFKVGIDTDPNINPYASAGKGCSSFGDCSSLSLTQSTQILANGDAFETLNINVSGPGQANITGAANNIVVELADPSIDPAKVSISPVIEDGNGAYSVEVRSTVATPIPLDVSIYGEAIVGSPSVSIPFYSNVDQNSSQIDVPDGAVVPPDGTPERLGVTLVEINTGAPVIGAWLDISTDLGTIEAIDRQGNLFIDNRDGTYSFLVSSKSAGEAEISVTANGQSLASKTITFGAGGGGGSSISFSLGVSEVDENVDQTTNPQLRLDYSIPLPESGLQFVLGVQPHVDNSTQQASQYSVDSSDIDLNPTPFRPAQGSNSSLLPFTLIDDLVFEGNEGGSYENAEVCLEIDHTVRSNPPMGAVEFLGYSYLDESQKITNVCWQFRVNDDETLEIDTTNSTIPSAITEGSSTYQANVVLVTPIQYPPIILDYQANDVTASGTSGEDYTVTQGSLTFQRGGSRDSQTIDISIRDDALDEEQETFELAFSSPAPQNFSINNSSFNISIQDNDDAPVLSVADVSVSEGVSTGKVEVTVSLDAISGKDVSFDYATSDDNATAGQDYTAATGDDIVISAGATTATFDVYITDDNVSEGSEALTITLSDADNATLSSTASTATVTITDNDALTVEFDKAASSGDEGTSSADLDVVVTGGTSASAITVSYTVSGTASGSEYTIGNGTLSIAATDTSAPIELTSIVDDVLDEVDETVVVTLTSVSGASLGSKSVHTYTIQDNDDAPVLSVADVSVSEGVSTGKVEVTVSLDAISGKDVSFDYATSDDNATAGQDYTAATGDDIVISAGATTATFDVYITDDNVSEGSEALTITLSDADNATLSSTASTATVTITDNDALTVEFDKAASSGDEGTSSADLDVVVTGGTSASAITVSYTVSGTASGSEYTIGNGTLSIAATDTSAPIELTSIVDDVLDEVDETVVVTLTSVSGASLGSKSVHTYTIQDNDDAPVLSVADVSVSEGVSTGKVEVTVSLDAISGKDVSFDYATSDDNATAGQDYTAATGDDIVISAGATTATFDVYITDDNVSEGSEALTITLSDADNATLSSTASTATVTITDNDALTVEFDKAASSGDEGTSSADLDVVVTGGTSASAITVSYTVSGTASGSEYTIGNGTLSIAAGDTSAPIELTSIVDDVLDEVDETVVVTLTSVSGASLGSKSVHTYTIQDNDDAPVLSVADVSVSEGVSTGKVEVTVSLDAISGKDVSFDYATSDDNATAGQDYTAATGDDIVISAGATTATFDVYITDDNVSEGSEALTITLSDADNATLSSTASTATVTITDNDALTVEFDKAASSGDEGTSSADLDVVVTGGTSASAITVSYTVSGTASGSEYTIGNGTLSIAAGDTSAPIELTSIVDDVLDEVDETVVVTLTSVSGASLGSKSVHTYTIQDNDDAPVLSVADVSVSEGVSTGKVEVTVSLDAISGKDVSFDYATSDDNATAGQDYTAATGDDIVISAGATTATFDVYITDDNVSEGSEALTITLSDADNATLSSTASTATVTITDNDALTVEFDKAASSGDEGTSSADLDVVVTGGTSASAITVSYTVSGTASGSEYTIGNGTLSIAAGDTSAPIELTSIVDDVLDEVDETVVVTLTSVSGASLGSKSVHTYTIQDNDDAPVLSVADVSVSEGVSTGKVEVTVSLDAISGKDVSFDYATSDDNATAGQDYTAATGDDIVISAGATTATFDVYITDDNVSEGSEALTITLSDADNATLSSTASTATVTITDNDALTVEFDKAASSGDEGTSSADLDVVVTGGTSASAITVSYTVSGTASGSEYTIGNGTLSIAAGDTSAPIELTSIVDDVLDEVDETVVVTLTSVSGASLGSKSVHTYTIQDNDDAPVLSVADVSVSEGVSTGKVEVTVSLDAISGKDVSFDYATSDDNATAGQDYTAATGDDIVISAGATTATFDVYITDDNVSEGSEALTITLSDADNATLSSTASTATVTITDNDALTVEFDKAASSGDEGTSSADLDVVVTGGTSASAITVSYTVSGTASGSEYTIGNGTLSIAAGDTSAPIELTSIVDDVLDEVDETVVVTLTSVSGASLGSKSVHTYTIQDNDDAPVLSVADVSVSEGVSTGKVEVTVSLDAISGKDVSFDYATSDDNATAGQDYTAATGDDIVISAGATTATFDVYITDDNVSEGSEALTITLSDADNATLSSTASTATVTITDNDALTVEFDKAASSGDEGTSSADLDVVVTGGTSASAITVSYTVSGTASGSEYTIGNGTLSIAAGDTSAPIELTSIVDDVLDEVDETVVVTLTSVSGASLGSKSVHTYTIQDNDDAPVLSVADVSVSEGVSTGKVEVTVSLDAISGKDVSFDYATSDDNATAGQDYTAATGDDIVISAGATTATFDVYITDDNVSEGSEALTITLSDADNATLSSTASTATVTITDNDALTVEFDKAASSGDEGTSSADLDVVVTGGTSASAITVSYTVSGTASGSEYTIGNGTLSIAAGDTSAPIELTSIVDDVLDEVDETVVVTLTSVSGASLGSKSVHTYTIQDNDDAPVLSVADVSVSEGVSTGKVEVTVSLDAISGKDVSFDYATSDDNATAGQDYTAATGDDIVISAGATTATFDVYITDDNVSEGSEALTITLSDADNATLSSTASTATVTITDNDGTPSLSFTSATSTVGEADGSASIAVRLSVAAASDVTATVTATGTATGGGDDYTSVVGSVTITAGQTTGSIDVSGIQDDAVSEGDETVILTLSNVSSNATLDSSADDHTLTITDNDGTPSLSFTSATSTVGEADGSASIAVRLSVAAASDVTATVTATGTATGGGDDYTSVVGSVTITAGQTTGSIDVSGIQDDAVSEGDETVILTLSNVSSNATLDSSADDHTLTITDNDGTPSLSFTSATSTVGEADGSASIAVRLSVAAASDVTATVTATGTATGGGDDYTSVVGSVTITAGQTTGSIDVSGIQDDAVSEGDETVILTLSNVSSNATLDSSADDHTLTITDNDGTPSLSFTSATSTVGEADGSASIAVRLSVAAASDVTATVTATGTATGGGDDYTSVVGSVTITAGQTTGSIDVSGIQDDAVSEGDETVILTLSNVSSNATLDSSADDHTLTITDNDGTPSLSFTSATSTVGEADGSASIAVRLSVAAASDVTATVTATGTATGGGDDYTSVVGSVTITAGQTTGSIDVSGIQDDAVSEGDETVILTLSNVSSNATLDSSADDHTLTITDNDGTPSLSFTSATSTVGEADGSASIAVRLSVAAASDVTATVTATGTATGGGDDYTSVVGSVTITAGQTTGSIDVSGIQDDAVSEGDETVILTLSNVSSNATLDSSADDHTLTITDNDGTPSLSFTSATSTVGEADGSASIAVRLSVAAASDVTATVTATGTATGGGDDYTSVVGSVTITAGQTTGSIDVSGIQDDAVSEGDETVILTLSNVSSNATLDSSADDHTLTITDNDGTPSLSFTSATSTVGEADGSASIAVRLSVAAASDVTATVTATGTATGGGDDYTSVVGSVTITAGQTTGSIDVSGIQDDAVSEGDETVILTLSNVSSNATLDSSADDHTLTITDNDGTPSLSFTSATSTVGEADGSASIAVRLSVAAASDVTATVTATGTATGGGDDYTSVVGSVTITAGQTTGSIDVSGIQDDAVSEGDETVILTLSNVSSNATLDSSADDHTLTITDNDGTPSLSFTSATSTVGEADGSASIAVRLSVAAASDVTATVTATGTATGGGDDYTSVVGSVTITAGQTTGSIDVSGIQDDAVSEGDETVILTLSNVSSNATLDSSADDHTLTITDNDGTPSLSFTSATSTVGEADGSASIAVRLSVAAASDVTATVTATGTATGGGDDYTSVVGSVTITAGQTTGSIDVSGIQDDAVSEGDETVILTLSNVSSNATLDSSADDHTLTITDNDGTPSLSFTSATSTVGEADGSASIAVRLSVAAASDVTATVTATGTATGGGDDYTSVVGSVTITAGQTTGSIDVSGIQDDAVSEGDETVILTLSNVSSNATLDSSADDHTLTITDNDGTPSLSFTSATSTVGEADGSASIAVRLSVAAASDVTATVTATGTATGGGDDYTSVVGSVTITAGQTTGSIDVSGIQDDAVSEGDETVILTLSNVSSNATLDSSADDHTLTITDNDGTPSLSFTSATSTVGEADGSASIAVRLSVAAASDVTATVTATGTATGGGDDYTSVVGSVTITAGQTTGSIDVSGIQDDAVSEGDETVILTLSNVSSNATLDSSADDHTLTITDNDGTPSLSFTSATSTVGEADGSASIAVRLSVAAASDVTATVTATGTATGGGDDYTSVVGSVTITAGQTTGSIDVSGIQDDAVSEGDETVILTLSNVSSNATLDSSADDHTLTITDNDGTPSLSFTSATSTVGEADGSASIAVRLSVAAASDVTATVTATGTATGGGDDYTSVVGSVTITAGQTTGSIDVSGIQDDAVSEGDETVILTLSNVSSNATLDSSADDHTLTITDNDGTPSLVTAGFQNSTSIVSEEDGSHDVIVSLSSASSTNVIINYEVSGSSQIGVDHTLNDGAITIIPGDLSGVISIPSIIDDADYEADETIVITIFGVSGALLSSQHAIHEVTISDNEAGPNVQFESPISSSQEGDAVPQINLRISIPSFTDTTVNYTITGTAQGGGVDHNATDGAVIIPIGQTTASIPITGITADGIVEDDETVIITINSVSNAAIGALSTHTHTIEGELQTVMAVMEEAEVALQEVADQLAQDRGSDMVAASQNLIKTSLDNLISNIQIGTGNTGQENTASGPGGSSTSQGFDSNTSDPHLRMRRDLVDAISMLNAEADDFGYKMEFGYDLNMPLIDDKQSIISKIAFRSSKQKDGPKAFRLIGSVALERRNEDSTSAVGKFLHFSREVADFETVYKGKKNTRSLAAGIYDVYRPSEDMMTSFYLTAGISDNDLKLKKGSINLDSKYLSYQGQFGISAAKTVRQRGRLFNTQISIDVYADYQSGHKMAVTSGLSRFNRLVDGKLSYELLFSFEPKTTFIFDTDDTALPYLFVASPVVKCGVGSMKSSCGGGTSFNLSRQLANDRGNWAFGYSFDMYRGTTSHEIMMNLRRNAYQNDNIQTAIEFGANENASTSKDAPINYFVNSKLSVRF